MTRAIACQSRTIRLPVHLSERLATVRKATMDLAHKLGAMPSRKEIATELGMGLDELDGLLRQLTTSEPCTHQWRRGPPSRQDAGQRRSPSMQLSGTCTASRWADGSATSPPKRSRCKCARPRR